MAPLQALTRAAPLLLLALCALSSPGQILAVRLSSNLCGLSNFEYRLSALPASGWYYRGSGADDYCNANSELSLYVCNVAASSYCSDETKAQTCARATYPATCNLASRVFQVVLDSDCDYVVACEYPTYLSTIATPAPPLPTPPSPVVTFNPPSPVPAQPTPNQPPLVSGNSGGASIGVIVGVVAGGLFGIAALVCVVLFCVFKKKRKEAAIEDPKHFDSTSGGPSSYSSAPKSTFPGGQIHDGMLPPKGATITSPAYYPAQPNKEPGPYAGSYPQVGISLGVQQPLEGPNLVGDSAGKVYKYQDLLVMTNQFSPTNLVGRGGFSEVYKGVHVDGTPVAVKVLQADPTKGPDNKSFHSEMDIMSRLRHKHLVSMLGYAMAGTQRIIVLEFCNGGTLFSALHGPDRLDWAKRLRTALDVTIGLEYLHEGVDPPILHRDIKSANVLFSDKSKLAAKLSDFGVAKYEEGAESARTRVLGTRGYVALEYLQSGQVSKYTDIYSLGVLLSELITGRPSTFQLGTEMVTLRDWVINNRHQPLDLMDPALRGNFHPQQAISLIELAIECMNQQQPKARPLAPQVHQRIMQLMAITGSQPLSGEKIPQNGPENSHKPGVYEPPPVNTNSLTGSENSYTVPNSSGSITNEISKDGFRRFANDMTTMQDFTNIRSGR